MYAPSHLLFIGLRSKVLAGRVRITSYDFADNETVTANGDVVEAKRVRPAKMVASALHTPESPPSIVQPRECVKHDPVLHCRLGFFFLTFFVLHNLDETCIPLWPTRTPAFWTSLGRLTRMTTTRGHARTTGSWMPALTRRALKQIQLQPSRSALPRQTRLASGPPLNFGVLPAPAWSACLEVIAVWLMDCLLPRTPQFFGNRS